MAVDSADKIFVTGSFRNDVDFDPGPKAVRHTSVGGRDIFAARYSPAGEFDLVRVSGSTLDDVGTGIVLDADDNALYTGIFRQTIDISTGTGCETLTSKGSSDAFLAKLALIKGLDDATVHLTAADLDGFQFQFYGVDYDELFYSYQRLDHVRFRECGRGQHRSDRSTAPGGHRGLLGRHDYGQRRSGGGLLGSARQRD